MPATRQASDVYDRHIEKLVSKPEAIDNDWVTARPLFEWCSECGGCLTTIRSATREELDDAPPIACEIKNDKSLPISAGKGWERFVKTFHRASAPVRRKMLEPFAKWQRRLDKVLKRKPPPMKSVK